MAIKTQECLAYSGTLFLGLWLLFTYMAATWTFLLSCERWIMACSLLWQGVLGSWVKGSYAFRLLHTYQWYLLTLRDMWPTLSDTFAHKQILENTTLYACIELPLAVWCGDIKGRCFWLDSGGVRPCMWAVSRGCQHCIWDCRLWGTMVTRARGYLI